MSSHPQSSLEAGLAALNQGDYQGAIATLEAVVAKTEVSPTHLQAQIGLVIAYTRSGNIPLAISLCETLAQSDNSQVQQWAKNTLSQLSISHPTEVAPPLGDTGFVPFDNSSSSPPKAILPAALPPVLPPSENPSVPPPESVIKLPLPPPPPPPPNINIGVGNVGKGKPEKPVNKFSPTNRQTTTVKTVKWRKAGRAKVWQPLNPINLIPLRLLTFATFLVLFWILRELIKWFMGTTNDILFKLPVLQPLQILYSDPSNLLLLLLVITLGISPWGLDWLLKQWYGQKPLDKDILNRYSHEAIRVIHRFSQQRRWNFPQLKILPITAPIAFSYGNLPRTARIVVSQGLLEQLEIEEIAAIYASELGHICHWDVAVISLVMLVTIPVHKLYQKVSIWGDKISLSWVRKVVSVCSSLVYGVWYVISSTALLLSQLRLYHSDRVACDTTGNPNALTRALLKIAMGIAKDIEKQAHTSWQLESLNLLIPVSYHQSISLGSIAPQVSFESFLMWDYLNPYRRWFTMNNSHPLMGDRIQNLCQIAHHWHIPTEINIEARKSLQLKPQSFFLHISPWLGIPIGIIFAGLIGLTWQIAYAINWLNLKWIYDDWTFVWGCMLIGLSIGILVRINFFFPDIKPSNIQTEEHLLSFLSNPTALPIDSIRVELVGTLLGRQGISNSLGQDLILRSSMGLVKLHHIPWWGTSANPQDWIGRQVILTGWVRRGATPWIDIHTLKTQSGKTINSPHPIFSIVVAVAATAWGAYLLLIG
ncbi:M48 family metalloprotease [Calothrix rhizosoleniae]|uniref:M48 family metalloprotease n=1 Tax=Calothrix rhizosoleniae TaxID=888997 RepID=UPI000B4A33B3|nr:zinc metalloprotease HtpX [Calothrix rhizosoleniae]